jgi:hypothetical protein
MRDSQLKTTIKMLCIPNLPQAMDNILSVPETSITVGNHHALVTAELNVL